MTQEVIMPNELDSANANNEDDEAQEALAAAAKDDPAPPWGSDDEFDPAKAWSLIQNLRGDKESLTSERDKYKKSVDEAETAKLSDIQRAEKERDDAKTAAESNSIELAKVRAAIKHGLSEEDLEFVGGKTAEEITASAQKLADRLAGKQPSTSKPTEQLRGGGDPSSEPDEDIAKVVADIPRT